MSKAFIGEVLAEYVRSGEVESHHMGHFLALNADGSIALQKGNPTLGIFPRSSVKSIQAAAMVRHGLKLEPRLLALVCASHSGTELHQSAALEILTTECLSESDLRNVKGKPLDEKVRAATLSPTRLAMNCSGKHAGMVVTSKINSWSVEGYLDPDHPLQVACREELEKLSGEKITVISVDGCGAPLFQISLLGLARAVRAITISSDPVHQEVIAACRAFPEMVAGAGRLTTEIMREIPGLFVKEGAEGVEIASLPDGRTFVFKITDGSTRAFPAIVSAALSLFGVSTEIKVEKVLGGGEEVGVIRATL